MRSVYGIEVLSMCMYAVGAVWRDGSRIEKDRARRGVWCAVPGDWTERGCHHPGSCHNIWCASTPPVVPHLPHLSTSCSLKTPSFMTRATCMAACLQQRLSEYVLEVTHCSTLTLRSTDTPACVCVTRNVNMGQECHKFKGKRPCSQTKMIFAVIRLV
jgi:hypothetical protein